MARMRQKAPDYAALGRRGGKARLKTMTPEERQEVARLGGLARLGSLSKAQKSELGRKAIQARWRRYKAKRRR